MSSGRRRHFSMKQPVAVADVGCSCRRTKLAAFLSSLRLTPRRRPATPASLSSSSLWPSTATSATAPKSSSFSLSSHEYEEEKKKKKKMARRRNNSNKGMKKNWSADVESVPVVKESCEPYADFRESMVQMIVENDLYAWDELNDLLHRFLSLNSPRHHNLILHAFADLWSGVFSPPSPCRWDDY